MTDDNAQSKYAASRALNELDARRAAGDWASDTIVIGPKLPPKASDETVPMLPALLRPQAD